MIINTLIFEPHTPIAKRNSNSLFFVGFFFSGSRHLQLWLGRVTPSCTEQQNPSLVEDRPIKTSHHAETISTYQIPILSPNLVSIKQNLPSFVKLYHMVKDKKKTCYKVCYVPKFFILFSILTFSSYSCFHTFSLLLLPFQSWNS